MCFNHRNIKLSYGVATATYRPTTTALQLRRPPIPATTGERAHFPLYEVGLGQRWADTNTQNLNVVITQGQYHSKRWVEDGRGNAAAKYFFNYSKNRQTDSIMLDDMRVGTTVRLRIRLRCAQEYSTLQFRDVGH